LHVNLQEAASVADAIDSLQIADLKVTLRSGLTEGDWRTRDDRLGNVLDMLFSLIKSVEIEKETQRIVSSDDFRTSALSNL
jgi:hypothetical protein